MINLGITRDKSQLIELQHQAKLRNINIIPLPLTEIVTLLEDESQIPDLTQFDWLFFSSANGVHSFFDNYNKDLLPQSLKIAVVAKKTADAVHSFDLDIHFKPSEPNGKSLFAEFLDTYSEEKLEILYVRADKVNFNAQEFLSNSNIIYHELISYKSDEKAINILEIEKLTTKDYILFTAPSNVTSYKNQFGTPKAIIIAIGNTTKDAIEINNWTTSIILDKPEIDKVLEQI